MVACFRCRLAPFRFGPPEPPSTGLAARCIRGGLGQVTDQQDKQPLPEDAALRAIVEGVESETGDRFFASLVQHLASALRAQYAFVSELSDDRKRFRTRALWGRGAFLPNIDILLAGTPCEGVLHGQMSHFPERWSSGITSSRSSDARTGGWTVPAARRACSTYTRARCAAGCRSSASGGARSRLRRSAKCRGRRRARGGSPLTSQARVLTALVRR